MTGSGFSADNSTDVLDKLSKLESDIDSLHDMVSVLSVSSTQNLADDIDDIRSKIVDLGDEVIVLRRSVGKVSGSDPSIRDSISSIEADLGSLSKKVDKLSSGYSWNGSTGYPGTGGYQSGLSMSISPQNPSKGDMFSIMVYDIESGSPASGAMVQGPGLYMMSMGGGGMMFPGAQMPSFGAAVADSMGLVYGQYPGGKSTYTARSQGGKMGSVSVGGGGAVFAWIMAVIVSICIVFVGFYAYYRQQMGSMSI